MENNSDNYKKDFVNFLNRIDCIKNELEKLKEEGYQFFVRLDKVSDKDEKK